MNDTATHINTITEYMAHLVAHPNHLSIHTLE